MSKFRLLTEADIEVRVAQVTENGASLLLYKTARTDMDLLDEAVGPKNWMRSHETINGVLFCTISVWDDVKQQWINKTDCGSESNIEKDKGASSDSFKRAGFNWGIGRELYTAPFIWVPRDKMNIKNYNGKFRTFDTFRVEKIAYDEKRNIRGLAIRNNKTGKRCFTWQAQENQ
jgi:hypothetical protein